LILAQLSKIDIRSSGAHSSRAERVHLALSRIVSQFPISINIDPTLATAGLRKPTGSSSEIALVGDRFNTSEGLFERSIGWILVLKRIADPYRLKAVPSQVV
jgi:hypothetical protein